MYEIEKNVPVPRGTQGGVVYPFREMQPGDSFFVPKEKAESAKRSAYLWGGRHTAKMTTRSADGGVRIWRVS